MVSFFVPGDPAAQGSKRHVGNGVLVESSKRVKPWRADVKAFASAAMRGQPPTREQIEARIVFAFTRPKSHYRTGRHAGELRPDAPRYCTGRKDIDKLLRAAFDALTGTCYVDDRQVVTVMATKVYDDTPGMHVSLWEVE